MLSRPIAVLHRMVLPDHVCPYGLKALDLLKRRGFTVEDRPLTTRAETDAFKAEHGVATTPQVDTTTSAAGSGSPASSRARPATGPSSRCSA